MILFVLVLSSCSSSASNIPERYIEAVLTYKSSLKDPSSLRIYGDMIVYTPTEAEGHIISIICDAKNSYGGYSGKEEVLILLTPEDDPAFIKETSEYYIDIRSSYEIISEITDEEILETMNNIATFEMYSGEELAKEISAEYFDS